jgi:hypothetical protein
VTVTVTATATAQEAIASENGITMTAAATTTESTRILTPAVTAHAHPLVTTVVGSEAALGTGTELLSPIETALAEIENESENESASESENGPVVAVGVAVETVKIDKQQRKCGRGVEALRGDGETDDEVAHSVTIIHRAREELTVRVTRLPCKTSGYFSQYKGDRQTEAIQPS